MKMKKQQIPLTVINPNAAGIDVGSRTHFVAIGQEQKDVKGTSKNYKMCKISGIACQMMVISPHEKVQASQGLRFFRPGHQA